MPGTQLTETQIRRRAFQLLIMLCVERLNSRDIFDVEEVSKKLVAEHRTVILTLLDELKKFVGLELPQHLTQLAADKLLKEVEAGRLTKNEIRQRFDNALLRYAAGTEEAPSFEHSLDDPLHDIPVCRTALMELDRQARQAQQRAYPAAQG